MKKIIISMLFLFLFLLPIYVFADETSIWKDKGLGSPIGTVYTLQNGGMLLVATNGSDNKLSLFDPEDGEPLWSTDVKNPSSDTMIDNEGTLYLAQYLYGEIQAFNIVNGEKKWEYFLPHSLKKTTMDLDTAHHIVISNESYKLILSSDGIKLNYITMDGTQLLSQVNFVDINHHWAENEIKKLAEMNMIDGFGDKTFRPENNVTREQFIKLIVQSSQFEISKQPSNFADVSMNRWSYPFIQTAVHEGILDVSEYDGYFKPEQPITREEMAVISAKFLKLKGTGKALTFKDKKLISKHNELIGSCVENGIIEGFEDHTFRPKANLTRAQAVVIINRILNYSKKEPTL